MKYLVCWAWEMDGHAGASTMVCSSLQAVEQYIKQSLLDDEGEVMGHITSKQKTDYGIEYYGTWGCGDFSITARPFKTFTEMTHKEVFTRTG
jgi:hypothetical protein